MTSRKSYRHIPHRATTLKAKKSLGQNFLVDESVVGRIIGAFDPKRHDVVLEIGPGHGALTRQLLSAVRNLYAIEFDRNLAAQLRETFRGLEGFTLLEDDALTIDFRKLRDASGGPMRLIANLPYNISTVILQRLFEVREVFSDCTLMFQREVVERITASPGTKERGYLTVMTAAYFDVEYLFDVSPAAFEPRPKVWSSVVRLVPTNTVVVDPDGFSELVSTAFAQKRKTIANNLKARYGDYIAALESAGIAPSRRAETLTLDEWLRLHSVLKS